MPEIAQLFQVSIDHLLGVSARSDADEGLKTLHAAFRQLPFAQALAEAGHSAAKLHMSVYFAAIQEYNLSTRMQQDASWEN